MGNFNKSYKLSEEEIRMIDSVIPIDLIEKFDNIVFKITNEILNEGYFHYGQILAFMEDYLDGGKANVEIHIDRIAEKEEREEELKELRKKFLSLTQEEKQFIVGGK